MTDIRQVLPEVKGDEQNFVQNLLYEMTENQVKLFVKAYKKKRKSPAVILFATLLGFIGFAGINRFLVGQPILGLVYLLTLGFYWIGTIIDIFFYKRIALKYNQKQAQKIANQIYVDMRNAEEQDISLSEIQNRQKIFDTYNEMVTQLLDQFQASIWTVKESQSTQAIHFSDNPSTSVPQEHAWKGWYIGKLDNGQLRYFYGIIIVLEGEVGNKNPVFGICHSEVRVPKVIFTKNMLKSELSKALEVVRTTSPIDLSTVEEYENSSDKRLLIPPLMDFAVTGEKLKYMKSVLEEIKKN